MNSEQQERIEQIQNRQEHNKSAASDYERPLPKYLSTAYLDIDFLLSQLDSDSQAANAETECTVCGGRFPLPDTQIVKNAGGKPERVCNDCTKGKPKVESTEWPKQLTIIRYSDGGFSATQAIPPDNASYARVYYSSTGGAATAMRDKIASALRATKETSIPVNRALEIIAEVTVEDL